MHSKFSQAAQSLFEIRAIDYFMASKLIKSLPLKNLTDQEQSILYYCLLALSDALGDGHTCLSLSNIQGKKLWANEEDGMTHVGYRFPCEDVIRTVFEKVCADDVLLPIVFDMQRLYMRRYWKFEVEVSQALSEMNKQRMAIDATKAREVLAQLFTGAIDNQKIAVANALNKQFIVIAGGPGTGKTTTVAKLLISLQSLHFNSLKVGMAAPTGKAAQRLNESLTASKHKIASTADIDPLTLESIPANASTIHRLLGVIHGSHNFNHNADNLLDLDVLLIDEISMVDLPLMARVLRALPSKCRLILLGDADQIASVEVGSILTDIAPRGEVGYSNENCSYIAAIIDDAVTVNPNGCDHVSLLTYSHRFKDHGGIGILAKAVINGEADNAWSQLVEGDEEITSLVDIDYESWLIDLVKMYYLPLLKALTIEDAFACLAKFRILVALRKGHFGVETLNNKIEDILYGLGCHSVRSELYHCRPIMVTRNDKNVGVFNGDVGLIWRDVDGKLKAVIPVDDPKSNHSFRFISPSRLPDFETVFAMTIHKTQGSEFETVAMVLPDKVTPILARELLYTGITRAKKSLSLYSEEAVFKAAVTKKVNRHSGLQDRLFSANATNKGEASLLR